MLVQLKKEKTLVGVGLRLTVDSVRFLYVAVEVEWPECWKFGFVFRFRGLCVGFA